MKHLIHHLFSHNMTGITVKSKYGVQFVEVNFAERKQFFTITEEWL